MGKEHVKAVYCHPAYLTSMQSTSCEMPGWMKHKLDSRLLGELSITSDMHMTTGKTIALTRQTFVGKVMSLLFNMLSSLS